MTVEEKLIVVIECLRILSRSAATLGDQMEIDRLIATIAAPTREKTFHPVSFGDEAIETGRVMTGERIAEGQND